jgi:hypothetical protein
MRALFGIDPGLTQQIFEDKEAIQKRCLRIIYCAIRYAEALVLSGLKRLDERGERFTRNMFEEMKNDNHPLHSILRHLEQSQFNLRKEYPFPIPVRSKGNLIWRDIVSYSISWRYRLYSHCHNGVYFIYLTIVLKCILLYSTHCFLLSFKFSLNSCFMYSFNRLVAFSSY